MLNFHTKAEAAKVFGGINAMARAVGISKQAVHAWPEELTPRQRRELIGTAIETNVIQVAGLVPAGLIRKHPAKTL